MNLRENAEKLLKTINETQRDKVNGMLSPELVSCDEENRIITLSYKAKDWERNVRDELHGGAVAAMFDLSMGGTMVVFYGGIQITTVELSISYIRPFVDDEYLFVTEIIHPGRKLARVQSKAISKKTGKIAATSTGTFMPLENKY